MLTLCPIFNLIQTYERVNNNNDLSEIDALLGCGIILFKLEEDEVQVCSAYGLENEGLILVQRS